MRREIVYRVDRPYHTAVRANTGAFCYLTDDVELVFEFGSVEAARDWCQNAVDSLTLYLESLALNAQVQAVDNLSAHLETTARLEAS